jgi:hypothetical protein
MKRKLPTNRKQRNIRAKTHRMRGGSTTEQIGASAQMRGFLTDRNLATRNLLHKIVHHESHNKFHDLHYNYDPLAQSVIDDACIFIQQDPNISNEIKVQMKIAREKAADGNTHNMGNANKMKKIEHNFAKINRIQRTQRIQRIKRT